MPIEKDKYTDLSIRAYLTRGVILNETSYIERLIDEYISSHFCTTSELKDEIMARLFSSSAMGLTAKKKLFVELIEVHNPEFVKGNSEAIKSLTKIIEFRNIVAHRILDTSESGQQRFVEKSAIVFKKLDGKEVDERHVFTEEMTNNLVEEIRKVIDALSILAPGFGQHPFPPDNPKPTA